MTKDTNPTRSGWVLITLTIILTLVGFSLSFIKGYWEVAGPLAISHAIGAGLAPVILALIVMGAFQIGRRFRNRRSRLKIYSIAIAVFSVITLLQIVQGILRLVLGL